MALVILPCDLPWWTTLQVYLKELQVAESIEDLLKGMKTIYTMCNVGLDPDEPETPDLTIFDELQLFLSDDLTEEERIHFFHNTLPNTAKSALNLKSLKPINGLQFSLQQQVSQIQLNRKFVHSLICHAFFSTFPKRTNKTHPTLQDFNFTQFFTHLNQKFQKSKLRSLFRYFDIMGDDDDNNNNIPTSHINIIRQVMTGTEWLTIDDWTECSLPLCPLMIKHECRMENADASNLFICFSNKKIGGKTLNDGSSKECMQFVTCPELLVTLLCVEALEDNEVVTIEGVVQVGKVNNPRQKGVFEPAQKPTLMNICCMDAENYSRLPLSQYEEDNVLRELNKALLGFRQKQQQLLHHTYHQPVTRRLSPIGESFSSTPTENKSSTITNNTINRVSKRKEQGKSFGTRLPITKGRFIILGSSGEKLPVTRQLLSSSEYSTCQSDQSSPEEYFTACTSVSESQEQNSDEETEDDDANARRYSGQLDTPEHRHMFAERLREALRRAQSSSTDSNYAVGISVSGSSIVDPNISMKRGGSCGFILEEDSIDIDDSHLPQHQQHSHSTENGNSWPNSVPRIDTEGINRRNKGGSSKYSFSTDYNSDLENVYDQLHQWLEEMDGSKSSSDSFQQHRIRDNAVIQFAGGLLKRTLSESFVGVPLTEGGEGGEELAIPENSDHDYIEGQDPMMENRRNSLKIKMAARSLSLELAKHKHKLAAQLMSVIGQKAPTYDAAGLQPVVTGNWGCGSRNLGDPQMKLLVQWIAASVAGVPQITYYTCSHRKLLKLDTVCRVLIDRQWDVGELVRAMLHFMNTTLIQQSGTTRTTSSSNETDNNLFETLINTEERNTCTYYGIGK